MKLSIATVCISGTLSQKLDAIAKAGFDGIEIFEQDFMTHHLPAADVGKLIIDHGLEITLFQPEETAIVNALMPSKRLQPHKALIFIDFVVETVSEYRARFSHLNGN